MQPELAGQRQFRKEPPLPRRPRTLTEQQQQAVNAYFRLIDIQNSPTYNNLSSPTIAGAYVSRVSEKYEVDIQALVATGNGDNEVQAEIAFETEVRKRAKEALQLEKQAYEDGLVFLQIGSKKAIPDELKRAVQTDIVEDLTAWTERRKALLSEPDVFDRYRIAQLTAYKAQLASPDHYVELPSRLDFEREMISLWLNGQSVLLSGYTGTGKSETAKHAAQTISKLEKGEASYPVVIRASDEAMLQDFMGDIHLVDGNTVYSRGPAAQALTSGSVVQLEEANLLPNERHLTVRDLLNRSAGQPIPLPNTDPLSSDKIVYDTVGEGYHYVATQNPKNGKYQRQETWAEVDRAYGHTRKQLYYMPPAEVYDLAIASLMDDSGGISLAEKDLIGTKRADGSYNGTLVTLINLAQEFQNAYTGLSQSAGGLINSPEELEKLIVDPATLVAMVKGFPNRPDQTEGFNEYISGQFMAEYINNPNYSAKDRLFVLGKMVQNGFFRKFGISNFEISGEGITQNSLTQALTGQLQFRDVHQNEYTSSESIARFDPYGHLAKLRTSLNLAAHTNDDVAHRAQTPPPTAPVVAGDVPMGLAPITPAAAPTKPPRASQPTLSAAETTGRDTKKGAGKLRRRMIATRIMRNLPPPLSFVTPYGRDGVIPVPDTIKDDPTPAILFFGLAPLPINLVTYLPTLWHKRLFKTALEKRQVLMLDVLQSTTGQYPVDAWSSIAKSYYDLKTLSAQSFRPRIDYYFNDPDDAKKGKWGWKIDESLSLADMIVDRFPKLQSEDDVHTVWNAIFGRGGLNKPKENTEDSIKTRLITEFHDVISKSQNEKMKKTARRYLNILASKTFEDATALEYFGDRQVVASIHQILTT